MSRRLWSLALLLLLTGCSVDVGSTSGEQTSADTQSPAEGPSPEGQEIENELPDVEADLEEALLTEDELPPGFVEAAGGDGGSGSEEALCPEGGQSLDISALTSVEAAFEADGAFLGHGIEQYGAGEAAQEMELVREEVAACSGSVLIEGEPATIEPMIFPATGDDTVAFRLEQTVDGAPVIMHLIGVRNGELISVLFVVGAGDIDPTVTIQLAELAQERLLGVPA